MCGDAKETCPRSVIVVALLGAVVGAVAALLVAPKPGYELRADIDERGRTLGEFTRGLLARAREWAGK